VSEVVYRVNRPEVIDEQFEDEYVLVNLRTGIYYSLSLGGAVVWDVLSNPATADEIVQHVGALYAGEPADLAANVAQILSDMEREELVTGEANANGRAPRPATPLAAEPRPAFPPAQLEKYTDMQALLLLDPIHQVDETGWPSKLPDAS
jgi:hypothetical protein